MRRRLCRWLAPVLLVGAFVLPAAPAFAQQTTAGDAEGKSERVPAVQYLLAAGCTIVVLVIVCKPSRKAQM